VVAVNHVLFDFFGAGLASALVGFVVTGAFTGGDVQAAAETALRSSLIGALCSISLFCGFGAALGFAAYAYGKALAKSGLDTTISNESLQAYLDEIVSEFPGVHEWIALADKNLLSAFVSVLQESTDVLQESTDVLPESTDVLPISNKKSVH
jgi:hypothetical protein